MINARNSSSAAVYLVGAGPGDIGLITMRAVECLKQADVILYDYLANPAALEFASPSAELVCLGNHRTGRTMMPDEITARLLHEAASGRTVVRLKSGDPLIFGRGGDEADALRHAGIQFEIVPGVTSGLAVAAFCEIPLTHHEDASAVALVTGREREGKAGARLDYEALAAFPGTLVIYMGVQTASRWSEQLMEHGKPPDTPVAIVRWCGRAQQQTLRCTLETVVDAIEKARLRPPSLFVVGKVVDRTPALTWFAARPLFGVTVLVAGSPGASQRLRDQLVELGANVMMQPAVRMTDPSDWSPVDAAIDDLGRYDWLVFTSANGVDHLIHRLFARDLDVRRFGTVKLATAGSGTVEALGRHHLRADLAPERFDADAMAQALLGQAETGRILLAGGGHGRSVLVDALESRNGSVDQIVVYRAVDIDEPDPDVATAFASNEIDWIAVTSAPTARSLDRLYSDALKSVRFASISPMTSSELREMGYEPAAEAAPNSVAGLVDTILVHNRAEQREGGLPAG